ncbi:MAG: hypothetical protein Kow00106_06820 [Anaerolineae bacterium]
MSDITLDTPVEELVTQHPSAIGFLAERGVLCVVCGEPFWGTLGELIAQTGADVMQREALLAELIAFLREREGRSAV